VDRIDGVTEGHHFQKGRLRTARKDQNSELEEAVRAWEGASDNFFRPWSTRKARGNFDEGQVGAAPAVLTASSGAGKSDQLEGRQGV
jgi:hypothetical protein